MLCVFGVLYDLYVDLKPMAMIIMCFSSSTIRDGAATRVLSLLTTHIDNAMSRDDDQAANTLEIYKYLISLA